MKADIKICTVERQFRQDQVAIMKRVVMVLIEHDLSVILSMKQSRQKYKDVKLRIV